MAAEFNDCPATETQYEQPKCPLPTIFETFPGIEVSFNDQKQAMIVWSSMAVIGSCASPQSGGTITLLEERSTTFRHDICNIIRIRHAWGECTVAGVVNGKLIVHVDANPIAKPLSK